MNITALEVKNELNKHLNVEVDWDIDISAEVNDTLLGAECVTTIDMYGYIPSVHGDCRFSIDIYSLENVMNLSENGSVYCSNEISEHALEMQIREVAEMINFCSEDYNTNC